MATQRFYDGQPGPDIRRELNNFEAILDGIVAAAQDASTSATSVSVKVQQWADAAPGVEVEPGKYSAKHWADRAQTTVTGGLIYRGSHSAASGAYPATPSLGDYYKISAAGTLGGVDYSVGDSIIYNGTGWDKIDSTDAVTSVAGRVGAVVLTKGDVGLSNVDNTSDANKPVSTATQAALGAKFNKTGGDIDGNINFTGAGRRITGDFSNATFANRVMFQSSTTNANTDIGLLPNGVASSAGIWAFNNGSDLTNTAFLRSYINSATDVRFESGRAGAYSFLPITFHTGGSERMRIDTSGNVLATSGALGYGAGAGGTVTQATSKSTSVTLNKPTGQITMNNAALEGGTFVSFDCNNSLLSAADGVLLTASTNGNYRVEVATVSSGVVHIRVTNITAGSLSEALVINFAIIKGATS